MRFSVRLATIGLALVFVLPASAVAWKEYDATWEGDPMDCEACHTDPFPFSSSHSGAGPHLGYATTTNKCQTCHFVHQAPAGGMKLLRRATVSDNCMVCHDGSGGSGVYGTLAARGVTVGAAHSIDATNVIPGGDPSTGGSRQVTFGDTSTYLSCDDCHTPHSGDVVDPYRGERIRFHVMEVGAFRPTMTSTRLLKRRPVGASSSVDEYGADWCAGCHQGRMSGLANVFNHPVDSTSTVTTPFVYNAVAIVQSDASSLTTMGPMGYLGTAGSGGTWHNRGYVMPDPRTADQQGHNPICQQCHEDTRDVGSVGAVTAASITGYGDGISATDNPRFQCFPHETENVSMLVETSDDLCTNCHSGGLP